MKKKFNPSAALGYKRIKPLYDKAVSDLVEAERTIEAQKEQFWDSFCQNGLKDAKIERQKEKLKAAGHMVGHLIRERDRAICDAKCLSTQLVEDQKRDIAKHAELRNKFFAAMHDVNSMRNTQSVLSKEVDSLRKVLSVHKHARGKAERERIAAVGALENVKSSRRRWSVVAGACLGFLVAACAKLIELGVLS